MVPLRTLLTDADAARELCPGFRQLPLTAAIIFGNLGMKPGGW
jgi:hypothetical protein